jgi:hypothetical protein
MDATDTKWRTDFGMFSEKGNQRIAEIIKDIVEKFEDDFSSVAKFVFLHDGVVRYHRLADSKEFAEAYDTEPRDHFKAEIDKITRTYWGWESQGFSDWLYDVGRKVYEADRDEIF